MLAQNKNILVLTYWGYNSPILNSYALPYIRIIKKNVSEGSRIFLFTLTPETETSKETYSAVREQMQKEGIILVNYNYRPFGLMMAFKFSYILVSLVTLIIKYKVQYIHAWCTPGGAIGYLLSLLTSKPLILDSFEPHAESMVETNTWTKNGFSYKLLFRLEKLQLNRAQKVICAAEGMINYSQSTYGIVKSNYYVKPACVDLNLFKNTHADFQLVPEINADSIVCVYIGKFGDIYLSQEVFDFFKVASNYWKEKFKVLLLSNDSEENIMAFCDKSNLDRDCIIKKFVHHTEVPKYMSLGTFGICPVRTVKSKQFCTPIKNGEYWAMGLPVIITKNISTDSDLIKANDIGYVLEDLNEEQYLNAIKKIDSLIHSIDIADKIRDIAEKNRNYSIAEEIYKSIYA